MYVIHIKYSRGCAVVVGRLVAGLSSRLPGSDSRPCQQRSVVYEVVMGQVFLRVRRSPPLNIIPPMLRTHLHRLCTCCSYQKHEWVTPGDIHQVMLFQTSRNTGHGTPSCYFGYRGTLNMVLPLVISDIEKHWAWYSLLLFRRSGTLDMVLPLVISDIEKHWTWYSLLLFRRSRNTGHGTPTCYFWHRETLGMVLPLVISDVKEHWTWYSLLLFRTSRNTGHSTLTCYFGHREKLDMAHPLFFVFKGSTRILK